MADIPIPSASAQRDGSARGRSATPQSGPLDVTFRARRAAAALPAQRVAALARGSLPAVGGRRCAVDADAGLAMALEACAGLTARAVRREARLAALLETRGPVG